MKEKITLSLDQHENARHGEEIFPLQKYVTPLWKEYPYVTAHWHEEAEFTRIEKEVAHIRSILKLMRWKREI
ncbi:MAG: hypothetical protein ACLVCH_07045 [Roseburia inulinivorans]